jgi:hypothetical protein
MVRPIAARLLGGADVREKNDATRHRLAAVPST